MLAGWSVAIRRNDGSRFLASSGAGVLPPVWPRNQRPYAARWARDLRKHGFKARVVKVRYQQPDIEPWRHG